MRQLKDVSPFEQKAKDRIDRMVSDRFKNLRHFSQVSGMAYTHLYGILGAQQHMNITHLGRILEGLGGDPVQNLIQIFTDSQERYVPESAVPCLEDPRGTEYTPVPTVSPATCGASGAITDGAIEGYKYFESRFLKGLHRPLLTYARGDSNHPIIQDGDLVLIDHAEDVRMKPDRKSFYLVNDADNAEETAITLKRVAVVEKKVLLVPANPCYDIACVRARKPAKHRKQEVSRDMVSHYTPT